MPSFNHASDRYLNVDGAQLYFEQCGDPAGEPVLVLHGGFGSLTDLNPLLEHLPDHYWMIGLDFRGHGRSTLGTLPLSYQRYQDDVSALLTHLGVVRCAVIGFSDGGIVGYRLAAAMPARVAALVTIGAACQLNPTEPLLELFNSVTPERMEQVMPDAVAHYLDVNPAPDFAALVDAVIPLWTDTGASGYPGTTVTRITAPTLIARGDQDHLFSLPEALVVRDRIPGASLLNVPFTGHELHKDAPALLGAVVAEFLAHPKLREA